MKPIRRAMAGLVLTIAAHATASAQTAPPDGRAAPSPRLSLAPAERAQPAPDPTEPMPVHAPARVPYMPVATPDSAGYAMPVSPGGRLGSFVRFHYPPAAAGADSLRALRRRDPAAAPRRP